MWVKVLVLMELEIMEVRMLDVRLKWPMRVHRFTTLDHHWSPCCNADAFSFPQIYIQPPISSSGAIQAGQATAFGAIAPLDEERGRLSRDKLTCYQIPVMVLPRLECSIEYLWGSEWIESS